MPEPAWQSSSRDALEAALQEWAGRDRYARAQMPATRGTGTSAGAHPLEFDESGFPIPQNNRGFVKRVARLLTG